MNKAVIVSIKGTQTMEDQESDTTEILTEAEYYTRNGKHYIVYEDYNEEYKSSTKHLIKISEDQIEMQKRGIVSTNMVFRKDSNHKTNYNTPLGEFAIETKTSCIDIQQQSGRIDVTLKYALIINGQYTSDNLIDICIKERTSSTN